MGLVTFFQGVVQQLREGPAATVTPNCFEDRISPLTLPCREGLGIRVRDNIVPTLPPLPWHTSPAALSPFCFALDVREVLAEGEVRLLTIPITGAMQRALIADFRAQVEREGAIGSVPDLATLRAE